MSKEAPKRIQLRRAKGWRKPDGAVTVARPTRWGNPFRVGALNPISREPMNADAAVEWFGVWLNGRVDATWLKRAPTREQIIRELRGRDLACWCAPGEPCHADVLLEIANT